MNYKLSDYGNGISCRWPSWESALVVASFGYWSCTPLTVH